MWKIALIVGLVLFAAVGYGWAGGFSGEGDSLPQPQISEITQSQKYLDVSVQIKGVYKGNYSKIGPPPVTRSDYIIEDATGQIFVSGPLPVGVSPKDLDQTIVVKAKVKTKVMDIAGQPRRVVYLQII
jgi:hypothetical protein